MISNILQKARDYEKESAAKLVGVARPCYHFSTPVGWLNDPNGFSYYGGKYHLFFQYYPYDVKWGPMHWGHATSADLVHWDAVPCALAPDTDADRDGCFSGSAIETADKKQLLLYTGVNLIDGKYKQAQCVAIGDGVDYIKYDGNPVAKASSISSKANEFEFRDPKIFLDGGTYYFVAVNCDRSDTFNDGRIVLFKSDDCYHWSFDRVLIQNNGRYGRMWECPDYFTLGGKSVILVSPMDMLKTDEYNNGNGVICLIGHIDSSTGEFIVECDQNVDSGIDFYATQTLLTSDGRRVMSAWMQNWDTTAGNMYDPKKAWIGQMILARELSIKDNHLYQTPVSEILSMRKNQVCYKDVSVSGERVLDGVSGRYIDLNVSIKAARECPIYNEFTIKLAQGDGLYTSISFRASEGLVTLDRSRSGIRRAIINEAHCKIPFDSGAIKFRILLDAFSVEVFINDGYKVMTALLDTPISAKGVTFLCDGVALIDVDKWDLL